MDHDNCLFDEMRLPCAQMRGTTPLHVAACHLSADFLPIVVLLLHAGALVDALDSGGMTPLQLCTRQEVIAHVVANGKHILRWKA